jgi:hypothetical protein
MGTPPTPQPGPGAAGADELNRAVLAAQSDAWMRQLIEQRKTALAAARDFVAAHLNTDFDVVVHMPLVLDTASYLLGERPARLAESPDATQSG